MNLDLNCLSLMELLELRAGADDPAAREHLLHCVRCRALLRALPADIDGLEAVLIPGWVSRTEATRPPVAVGEPKTGTLWRALPSPDANFAWVVAVIGRSPDADDRFLVAPVVGAPQLAVHTDLILGPQVLGYPAFIDTTNLGTVLDEQLYEPIGLLEQPVAQALVAMYRFVLGVGQVPADAPRGLPVVDEADARLLEQVARADALRELWRPTDRLVQDARGNAPSDAPGSSAGQAPLEPALSQVLADCLENAEAEWDRGALLETSGIDSTSLDGFLADRLDLTDKTDVRDLARVVHTLKLPWAEAEPAVTESLRRSTGGSRRADGPSLPMAARSPAGGDPETTARDLYADQSSVDESAPAREREIANYLSELRRELDELE